MPFFSSKNSWKEKNKTPILPAFSLLEVLIALFILSLSAPLIIKQTYLFLTLTHTYRDLAIQSHQLLNQRGLLTASLKESSLYEKEGQIYLTTATAAQQTKITIENLSVSNIPLNPSKGWGPFQLITIQSPQGQHLTSLLPLTQTQDLVLKQMP